MNKYCAIFQNCNRHPSRKHTYARASDKPRMSPGCVDFGTAAAFKNSKNQKLREKIDRRKILDSFCFFQRESKSNVGDEYESYE